MREKLLRKIIRTKLEIGMHMINELPQTIQQRAENIIIIFHEELMLT